MKTIIIAIVVGIMAVGCGSIDHHLNKIPNIEFESFEYHRGGNASSADIIATGAKLENGQLKIDSVSIIENVGPFFSLSISLKGYRRGLVKE